MGSDRLRNPLYGKSFSTLDIHLYKHAAECDRQICNLHLERHLGKRTLYGNLLYSSYHRFLGASHSHIGDVCSATFKNTLISCLHMGMGSNHSTHLTIQVTAEGLFLGAGFRMEIHQYYRCLFLKFFCQLPAGPEGAVYAAHVLPSLKVHDSKLDSMLIHYAAAVPWHSCRKIGRPQNSIILIQIWVELRLLPHMVASGYDIGTALEELVGSSRQKAEAIGRILAVYDSEVCIIFFYEILKIKENSPVPRLPYYVAKEQDVD